MFGGLALLLPTGKVLAAEKRAEAGRRRDRTFLRCRGKTKRDDCGHEDREYNPDSNYIHHSILQ
jgi:hypothetical protein